MVCTFFASLTVQAELCCDLIEKEHAVELESSGRDHVSEHRVDRVSFCAKDSHEDPNHPEKHPCMGCSHAPIAPLKVIEVSYLDIKLDMKFSYHRFSPSPFLEGPLQPPRA